MWRLPELSLEMASPDAALHLGPQHVVIETAALEVAATAAGTARLQAVGYHCMFVARGKVGPFRATAQAFSGHGDIVGARVVLNDEGNGDRIVTSATAQFRIIP